MQQIRRRHQTASAEAVAEVEAVEVELEALALEAAIGLVDREVITNPQL